MYDLIYYEIHKKFFIMKKDRETKRLIPFLISNIIVLDDKEGSNMKYMVKNFHIMKWIGEESVGIDRGSIYTHNEQMVIDCIDFINSILVERKLRKSII